MNKGNISFELKSWNEASLIEIHHQTHKWQSELSFIKEEIVFMLHVISKYFNKFVSTRHIDDTFYVTEKIEMLEKDLEQIKEDMEEHERDLVDLYVIPDEKDEIKYREAHGNLAKGLYHFLKKYNNLKKTFFLEAEEVLRENELTLDQGIDFIPE